MSVVEQLGIVRIEWCHTRSVEIVLDECRQLWVAFRDGWLERECLVLG